MAEWGLDAATLDPLDNAMLMTAYMRRKQWEAERVAVAVWDLLGKAMGGRRRGGAVGRPATSGEGRRGMSGMAFLSSVGVEA